MDAPQPAGGGRPGCAATALFAAAIAWVSGATFAGEGVGWVVEQVALIQDTSLPFWLQPALAAGLGLLLAVVVAPLAAVARPRRLRAVYRVWALAIVFLVALGLVRLLPREWAQLAALLQTLLALAGAGAALRLARRGGEGFAWQARALAPALALTPVVVAPYLAFGALGSPLDLVLDVLAGLSFGLFAGVLLETRLFRPLAADSGGAGPAVGFGGLAAAATLAILGAGYGFAGGQLLLLVALPPLGFALAALRRAVAPAAGQPDRAWLTLAGLAGVAAAAPLALFDPEELLLLLGGDDVPTWAARAAVLSGLIGLALGLALWALGGRLAHLLRPRTALAGLAITWVGALALYLAVGQPGFHGDRLFVVLRDQADLGGASGIADRAERARFVYVALTRHAAASQAELRARLDRLGIGYRSYYLVNGLEVDGGPLVRLYLLGQPEVDRVLDSPRLRPLPAPLPFAAGSAPRPAGPTWNVASVGADRVWAELGVTGEGIVVGQSDSGVDGGHPALRAGYRGLGESDDYNWLDPWNGTASPTDRGGHGTHTLGTALGRDGVGIAPGATWFACVNLARNLGNPAKYLNCMQFMLAPYPQGGDPSRDGDPSRGANVSNNSWGCPPLEGCDPGVLDPGVRAMRAAGIFVVAAAGNSGPACGSVADPIAIYAATFSVGAVDEPGNVASFSSRGPVEVDGSGRVKPDVLAPGVDVLSSFPQGTYEVASGTSSAGPHVAGVVALMWSAQPKLIGDVERTEQLLVQTARPYRGTRQGCFAGGTPSDAYGYGLVDAYAAVKAAQALR